jgi:hypothetical protein
MSDSPHQAGIRVALKRLGQARLENFLRAIRSDGASCLAVRLINEELDQGKDPAAVLLDGDEYGYSLHVKGRGRRFRIEFGCCPGPMLGDGGSWNVEFDQAGAVVRCEGDVMWMASLPFRQSTRLNR